MLNNFKDSIDFYIRCNTKFSRKNFVETNTALLERNIQENLYTEDVLSRFLDKSSQVKEISALDIGCKNWFYAKGEYNFLKSFSDNFILDGIELDAYRLYSNFYSRYEVAKYHIKGLENTNYIVGNLLDLTKKYDYIFWFLPFVFKEPLRAWGLPDKFYCPQKMLKHAYSLLNFDGEMIIINQGIDEAIKQENLLKGLSIQYTKLEEIKSPYCEYNFKRYGFLVKKL